MEEEAELGCTEACHEEIGIVPGNKVMSETDEPGIGACDEDVGRSDSMMAKGAGCVVTSAWTKAVRIIGMKGVSCDKLEARGLEVTGASDEAPLSEVRECASSRLGKNGVMWV